MVGVILAAGYGTRMYPFTKYKAKCLFKYDGKTVLHHLIDNFHSANIKQIIIITNDRFFRQIYDEVKYTDGVQLISNHTFNPDERLGASNDLKLVLNKCKVEDDVIMSACDKIYNFNIKDFISFNKTSDCSSLAYYIENNINKLTKTGIIQFKPNGQISFYEKPKNPPSHNASLPIYILKHEVVALIKRIHLNSDSPGQMIQELVKKFKFNAYKTKKAIDCNDLNDGTISSKAI